MSLTSSIVFGEFFVRCMLSLLLGGLIGLERELKNKPAGVKTHILICLGATALTFLSIQMSHQGDPGRIAAQIVSGIGFIGGGAILHSHKMIQGLTTASTLWAAASLGMLIGAGLMIPACLFTAVCLFILLFSYRLTTTKISTQHYSMTIQLTKVHALPIIEDMLHHFEINVDSKTLTRKKNLYLELNYYTTPMTQHLFLKRLLSLHGVGDIQRI
jgi:uncharacterized membrane protein YhiD involved in acid resistance